MAGRPSKYNAELQKKAEAYAADCTIAGDVVPTAEGLALYLGVSSRIIYNWRDEHEALLHTLEKIKDRQKSALINKGLQGEFNATIAKLMLANHGLHEKQDVEHSGRGGDPISIKVEFID